MNKKKIITLILFLAIGSLTISKLDKKLRYKIDLIDYYRYNAPLTEKEHEIIGEKDFLVGIYNYPPLTYTNEFNNYNSGIIVDYISQLAIELRSNIHIKAGPKDSLADAQKKDEIDIIMVEDSYAEEIKENIGVTQPLCVVKTKILVKKNLGIEKLEDLENKDLVALERDNINGRINEIFKDLNNINIIVVENIYQCFALLNKDAVAGFIGDDMEAAHFLQVTNKSAGFKFLKPTFYEKEISLAVKSDNKELQKILNKGILQLKKKNLIVQTQYKWLGNFDTDGMDLGTITATYRVLIIIIFIIGGFSSWNYIITQRVNTKTRELSESKEELRLIIDTMRSGIMVIEDNSIILECNDAIAEITDIPKEKLIGFNYKDIRALEPFVNKDNMNMIFNVGNNYYYITDQKIASNKSMIVIEDYTEKYLKEKRERQESKMIAVGQLSAGLAHEVRNPLGLIKSYIYIIEKHRINEICKHAISVINDSINRINALVENLLRFSRLSNDELKWTNIKRLVNSIIDEEKENIKQNDINIICSFTGQYKNQVLINKEVLRMVLINLINNAIESFDNIERKEKNVHINVNMENDRINIEINDNGCGIEKIAVENIFDPFYSTKESGIGLGLYIINAEITNNGGNISVESNHGEGTKFSISLPILE